MIKPYTLYYIYDPMCAWCYGFGKCWQTIKNNLDKKVTLHYLVGGLAPDNDEPMPESIRQGIQQAWISVAQATGVDFNKEFWQVNTPRRSTYPACRACLVAREFGVEVKMIQAIQQAYYQDAKNPSNEDVLLACALEIGLDKNHFLTRLKSEDIQQKLTLDLKKARGMGGNSFPSLLLDNGSNITKITIDYNSAKPTLNQINQLLESP